MPITNLDRHTVEVTAHHEAGHAVAAYHFRNSIRERGVTVDLDRPGNGAVHTRCEFMLDYDRCRTLGGAYWKRWQQQAEWEIICTLAGPLAEARYVNGGRSPSGALTGDTPDMRSAHELLGLLNVDTELAVWMFCDQGRRILRELKTWGAVCGLAARLIQTGYVSAEDTEALFETRQVPQIPKAVWIGRISPQMAAGNGA